MSHFRPWPYPRVLAHRGGGTLAPENTLAALRVGHEHGYRAAEFDAMLAADGVPVLMHDDTIDRTTDGRGATDAHTAAQLARRDAGGWHSELFRGEPVPTLQATLDWCRAHAVWTNIEIKPQAGSDWRTGDAVARVAARHWGERLRPGSDTAAGADPVLPLLSSFSARALAAARNAAPGLPRGLLVESVGDDWQGRLAALGCVALHTDQARLTRAQARAIKDAGYWLFCYTVNEPARARTLFDWGVDAFCTDRIDLIAAA
jgi:glycerophosphoryl diester phosphodiesterase